MQDHTSSSALENAIALQKFGVGQPVRRKEDDTLVRGKGKYTDDFNLPGQAYAWIVRSTHAHGIIRGIDTSAAKTMPGVLGVWTGADLAAANYGPYTCGLPLKSRDGTPLLQTNRTALMTDKVRYVGDPVAFVVAETPTMWRWIIIMATPPRSTLPSRAPRMSQNSISSTPASPWWRWSRARASRPTTKRASATRSRFRPRASPAIA
jgi:xanthine dehydrogenase molybdopterin-binding subunit B